LNSDVNYENLKNAVEEYDKAAKALGSFNATYYPSWQVDQPMTAEERRADDQIRRAAFVVTNAHKNCTARLILAAKRYIQS
jgi:hypothetical protein